jgi:hypothetical protein
MEYCSSCGMPLEKEEDIRLRTSKGPLCEYCVNSSGKLKSCKEVFDGGVGFF